MPATLATVPTIGTPTPYAVWCDNHGPLSTRV